MKTNLNILTHFKKLFGGSKKEPTENEKIPDASMTRQNNKEADVAGKAWYHPDTDKLVPVEPDSVYHTREVAINPHKFGLTDKDLHEFYKDRGSPRDSTTELSSIKHYDFEDWSDEVVHGMHDRGWLRVNHKTEEKTYYIGGNSIKHISNGIKKLVQNKTLTPGYSILAHAYEYGKDGNGGKSYNISYDQAKTLVTK